MSLGRRPIGAIKTYVPKLGTQQPGLIFEIQLNHTTGAAADPQSHPKPYKHIFYIRSYWVAIEGQQQSHNQ